MTPRRDVPRVRFHSGWRALRVRMRYFAYLGIRRLRPRANPLLRLGARRGGALATSRILRQLKICKIVEFDGSYYHSLMTPHWPSRPFDRMAADGGLNIALAGGPGNPRIGTAILAITRRCPYRCGHCYESDNISERDSVPGGRWQSVVRELQQMGTGTIVFSGGEPMTRFEDLIDLVRAGDKDLSDFHIHTSGYGVTPTTAARLREAGLAAAGVGLDDVRPERHDRLRGANGAHARAVAALQAFREAGIFPYVNMCLTRELVRSGDLGPYLDLLKDLGVGIVRFLEPKPWGGYRPREAGDLFSEADRRTVTEFYEATHGNRIFKDHPLILYEAYYEAPERLGCLMGGVFHLYIDSAGHVRPCVFLPVSFGNIMTEDLAPIFRSMRQAIPRALHTPCPSLQLSETIRSKVADGAPLPVPFERIEPEWTRMFVPHQAGPGDRP